MSLAMVGCLFFVFGLVSWVNSILVPYFKVACDLQSGVQTYLVTFAFYIAYLVMTVPASFLLKKVGYKKGAMIGLFIMATGTLLFWPAALTRTYAMFLAALFVIGTSLAILQSVANPFVTIIGPHESAAKRISVMGICNKFAGIIAPLLFAAVVIRPEDVELVEPENGTIKGVVTHLIFKGVHYEMEVMANGFEWLVHSTSLFPVGTEVGIKVDPFNIQIMNKPESEDEEAAPIEE